MHSLGHQRMLTFGAALMVLVAFGQTLRAPAAAETTLEELCGPCKVEVFAKGGKFLEGPAIDQAGNLWVVSINSGAVSQITLDGKWTDVFHTGGQPQGLKFHKDSRLFGVDQKKGVFSYDPKAQKMADYVLYFQNQNFPTCASRIIKVVSLDYS